MQIRGYHGCWGCSITVIDRVEDFKFPYSRFLRTRSDQKSQEQISRLTGIFGVSHISDVFLTLANHGILGGALSI